MTSRLHEILRKDVFSDFETGPWFPYMYLKAQKELSSICTLCDYCKDTVHLKCLPSVNKKDSLYRNRDKIVFYCSLCLRDIIAYNRLHDKDFIEALAESWENQPSVSFERLENQELIFSPFDFNDNFDNPLHDADPGGAFQKRIWALKFKSS